mmetsp:Transcript_53078/g.106585  ORF Transcript_53078/g.106585 Transcript_53078/m.106585 type:complete len:249 (-) Transcript_53078:227-973(-)
MPRRERDRDEAKTKPAKTGEDVPALQKAKELFAPPTKAPPLHKVRPPPMESEAMASRVARYDVQPAVIPTELSRSLRLRTTAPLSESVSAAASSSGYLAAKKVLRKAAYQEATKRIHEERLPKPPEPGTVSFTEQSLRKAFAYYDLDKNEFVGAKELKHVFAMIGESPSDQEIDGMIHLCDVRGEGQVAFEDFLAIFSNPAESLRNVDVEALRQIVMDKPNKQDSSEDESEEVIEEDAASSSGAGSSP